MNSEPSGRINLSCIQCSVFFMPGASTLPPRRVARPNFSSTNLRPCIIYCTNERSSSACRHIMGRRPCRSLGPTDRAPPSRRLRWVINNTAGRSVGRPGPTSITDAAMQGHMPAARRHGVSTLRCGKEDAHRT